MATTPLLYVTGTTGLGTGTNSPLIKAISPADTHSIFEGRGDNALAKYVGRANFKGSIVVENAAAAYALKGTKVASATVVCNVGGTNTVSLSFTNICFGAPSFSVGDGVDDGMVAPITLPYSAENMALV